jgi:hypothetical protein
MDAFTGVDQRSELDGVVPGADQGGQMVEGPVRAESPGPAQDQ